MPANDSFIVHIKLIDFLPNTLVLHKILISRLMHEYTTFDTIFRLNASRKVELK